MTPSTWDGNAISLFSQRLAFPLHKVMASLWKRYLLPKDVPSLWPCCRPMARMVSAASLNHPPKVSTAKGMKSNPAALQGDKWVASFREVVTSSAWPAVVEASWMVSACNGEVAITSRAAGRPLDQMGRKTSAGRNWVPTMRAGASFLGPRAADCAAVKMALRRASCRATRSLFPPHPTWWSPKVSAGLRHWGQAEETAKSGSPSQYLRHNRNSLLWRCRPSVGEGSTFSQSPACCKAEESVRALWRVVVEVSRRRSKLDSSMVADSTRWQRGTSMSSTEIQSGLPAAKSKDATVLGRHPGVPGLTPSIFSTIGRVWSKDATKAAGAWWEAQRRLSPPLLLGIEGFSSTLVHADDVRSIAPTIRSITQQATEINSFVSNVGLSLNISKLDLIQFSQTPKDPIRTTICNQVLHTKKSVRCLGTLWSVDLSAKDSVKININKARRAFFGLGSIGVFHGKLNSLSGSSIFDTCIVPILLFGCETWILDSSIYPRFVGKIPMWNWP